MAVSEDFRKRLNEIIFDLDVSKNDFTSMVGVNKSIISHATVYGIVPSLKNLIKIADKLDLSLDYLLGKAKDNYFYKADKPSDFHKRLIELTNENNTKFSAISHSMPFARNLFYEWIRRKGLPNVENLYYLAEYFNVSPDYLLGRTDDRN